jgi:GAF domain-containing protein
MNELDELFDAVRAAVQRAGQLGGVRARELEERLASMERELADTEQLLIAAEAQAARVASLYAAAYQLHSLDPAEVRAAIGEIAVDLLGARRCILLMTDEAGAGHEVVELVPGAVRTAPFDRARYEGGDALVDAALADGLIKIAGTGAKGAVAIVPFTMQGTVVGALVVLELVPHKAALQWQDRELLDLLAAHAASALVGARVFHDTQRKLKTLEGLVALLRRPTTGGAR